MEVETIAQIIAFALFAFIAVAGALGMATTMSMFRSGIFLMASFIGVAGLFILLSADLLGMLQVMMYIGGMLVMILFMLLFSSDPGGERMTSMMKLPLLEKLFSLGLAREDLKGHGGNEHDEGGEGEHEAGKQQESEHEEHEAGKHHEGGHEGHGGGHGDMSMTTPIKKPAAVLGFSVGALLLALVLVRPAFPAVEATPDPRSAERIGDLLMGQYMIAFEGAGLLILLGIFGAVYTARPARHPDPADRDHLQAAVDEPPMPIDAVDEDEGAEEEPS